MLTAPAGPRPESPARGPRVRHPAPAVFGITPAPLTLGPGTAQTLLISNVVGDATLGLFSALGPETACGPAALGNSDECGAIL